MNNEIIGKPQKRVDGRLKVTGQALYAADQAVSSLSYAYGVYSTVANGRIVNLDDQKAKSMPGVLAVLSHKNFPQLHRTPDAPLNFDQMLRSAKIDERRLPFEDEKISYSGQFVALVVAETFEQARAAARYVRAEYAEEDAITSLAQGMKERGLKSAKGGHQRGDTELAWQSATSRLDQTYTTPVEVHVPMEMHATTAYWRDGMLYVYESTQGVVNHRNVLANVFNLPPNRVEVHAPFIGSGFGGKLFPWPHSIAACAAAKVVDRPVQLVVPRGQMFTTVGHRPETSHRIRLATDAQGKLTVIRHEAVNSTSATDTYVENCTGMTKALYSCANVLTSQHVSPVNRGTPTSMRAPGAAPGLFALESAIDELAMLRGEDPLDFRKLNLAQRDESLNLEFSSIHLAEAIDQAAERFGWRSRKAEIGSMRDGDEVIGYGIGVCCWEAFQVPTDARVSIRSDGSVLAQCGLQDIGTGTYTVVAQLISELTGVSIERVEVELGSSTLPPGPLSGGSWATASVLPAMAGATRMALDRLRGYARGEGGIFSSEPDGEISVDKGQLMMGTKRATFAQVLERQRLSQAEGHFSSGMEKKNFSFHSFGAHFVEVRWDPGISHLRVSRVVSAIDVGRVVNPLAARNQVEGAIVMGIGMALFEAAEFDPRDGRPINNNYAEYVVPVHADQPEIDVILLDHPDPNMGEFGARGIGEIGTTGLAAAVANAVYHATGRRIRDLPITKEKLMAI